ncbi:hypothetical protein [Seonamhaeicola aphaedonensis]|uniref:Uncharacterized protein n=1 Tax=Seonamhaeicola aphaedonensis TaxID=1461338 RepID=A0A3D9HLF0_9FLAO|nr:hypothetical protein [Seonamhaeicola aphaedonensis]RED50141.1 hypothetical protein DFQ02_101164 [Seonamhaeicola aphaedonensis]
MKKSITQKTMTRAKNKSIDLIDGVFNVSDAADIINSVLDVKINYHKLKRLSRTEGNINDLCEYDNARIDELIKAKEDTRIFFNELRQSGKKLKINGIISIEEA